MSKRYPLASVLLSQVPTEPGILLILQQIASSRLTIQEHTHTTLANNDTSFLCPTRGFNWIMLCAVHTLSHLPWVTIVCKMQKQRPGTSSGPRTYDLFGVLPRSTCDRTCSEIHLHFRYHRPGERRSCPWESNQGIGNAGSLSAFIVSSKQSRVAAMWAWAGWGSIKQR